MPGSVSWRLEGAVAILSFDNSGRLNAIDQAIADGLVKAVAEILATPEAGAVLLRGEGLKAFSAGIDLKYADGTGDRKKAFAAIDGRIEELRRLLVASEIPILCLLSGVCYGGGLMLAGFADLRIASSDLRFAMPALDNGLFYPAAELARLVEIVGLQHVRSLFLQGGPIPPEELLSWGLVDRVCAPTEIEGAALALAAKLAGRRRGVTTAYRRIFDALAQGDLAAVAAIRSDAIARLN